MNRNRGIFATVLGLLAMLILGLSTPDLASASVAPAAGCCRPMSAVPGDTVTAVSYLHNWPDNGHGTPARWQLGELKRTLTIKQIAMVDPRSCGKDFLIEKTVRKLHGGCWSYEARIDDVGSFTTLTAGSPRQNKPNTAGLQGTETGYATWTFYADTPFVDQLLTDTDYDYSASAPKTPEWYKLMFIGETNFYGAKMTAYSWTYKAPCDQQWVDSSSNHDGTDADAGDIVTDEKYSVCPSPTPTPTPTETESPSPTPTPTETKPADNGGTVEVITTGTVTYTG